MVNTKINKMVLVCALLLLSISVVAAEKLFFERQLTAPVLDFKTVEIIAGAGTLKVNGIEGEQLTVDATVKSADYAKVAELVDEFETKMLFYIRQEQGNLLVMAKPRKSMFNTPNIQIDIQINLPSHMNLLVDDGSGSIVIENINGHVDLDDESGSLQLKNIRNDVKVKDAAGSITISDIIGQVNIDDKAGSIKLSKIEGDVVIKDRSGSIEAAIISGNMTLDDGSGDVRIDGLSGQFKLINDGSGELQVNGKTWPKK